VALELVPLGTGEHLVAIDERDAPQILSSPRGSGLQVVPAAIAFEAKPLIPDGIGVFNNPFANGFAGAHKLGHHFIVYL
jgi:hypothetical protein